jgi:BASS family bile acid:Na+ symporter
MQLFIDNAVPVIAFTLLMAVGMDLTGADFARVRRQPAVVLIGVFGPVVLLPLFAAAIVTLFTAHPDVAAGLLLVAACPVGGISNVFSYLAGASPALSVTLTGVSCLFAAVTVPLVSLILETLLDRPLGLSAPPGVLFRQLVVMLAVPAALGFWVRRRWPEVAIRYKSTVERASFVGVSLLLTVIIASDVHGFVSTLRTAVPVAVAFIAGAFAIGWATSIFVTRDPRDRFTLAVEFGTRNVGVALAIAVTVLGRVEFARFGATYFLTEIPLMLGAVAVFRSTYKSQLTTRNG